VTSPDGNCEYNRQVKNEGRFPEGKIPAMLYIDKDGNLVDMTEMLLTKEELEQRLQKLAGGSG
jgi:hypothetical protein